MGASFARTSGTGRSGVLLLGEALGESEAIAGKPFQGAAGAALTSILHRGGWKKDDFLVANVVNCHPPNNALEGTEYEVGAIEHCRQYLEETLAAHPEIKVIVPMGNVPLHVCLGVKGFKNWHGSVTWHERWKRWIVPSLDLEQVRKKGLVEVPTVVFDIARALRVKQDGKFEREPIDYIEYPTEERMLAYVEEYEVALALDPENTWLSVDIETPYSADIDEEEREDEDSSYTIIRASMAFAEGKAISFPWTGRYIEYAKRALASPGTKITWNGNKFDKPRLAANGCVINHGTWIDAMDAWHFLYSDLPRGLGYVAPFFTTLEPWKHLSGSREEFYSAQDAWAALGIAKGVKRELVKLGSWTAFLNDFVALEDVFNDLSSTGIGIDEDKRGELRAFYEDLRDNSTRLIQEEVPTECKPWVKKDGYKGKPKEVREWLKANPNANDDDGWHQFNYERIGESWNRRDVFNPNSPPQILNYIRQRYGEGAVPTHKKTGKPTTGEEELERLARRKGDRVLELVVDASAAGTKLSNFINNWPVGRDGRVHPTFTNIPATFRLSSKNPNAQNFPSRDAEAKKMREMVVPGAGFEYLVESDFTGIEAILVGWYAKDEQYIRLAKRGVHDFLAAHMMARDGKFEPVSLSLSDNDLTLALKEAKAIGSKLIMPGSAMCYRDGAKPTVHGSNYGMGPVLMYRNHPEVFGSEKEARILQRLYLDLFPSIERWQASVVDRAYYDSGVTNCFGYRRKLYNVKRWAFSNRTGKWELVWADDAKKAIATIPQGTAAGIIRRAMLTPAFGLLRAEGCAMIQIHDSLLCRARNLEHVAWVAAKLKEAMIWPIPEMGGLKMLTETKFGVSWGQMKKLEV